MITITVFIEFTSQLCGTFGRFAHDSLTRLIGSLAYGVRSAILLINGVLTAERTALADRIAQATGARLIMDTFVPRLERGAGRVNVARLPYFGEQAAEVLAGTRHLVLIATQPPVTFFAYPDKPNWLTPEGCDIHSLVERSGDIDGSLDALSQALDAGVGHRVEKFRSGAEAASDSDQGFDLLFAAIVAVGQQSAELRHFPGTRAARIVEQIRDQLRHADTEDIDDRVFVSPHTDGRRECQASNRSGARRRHLRGDPAAERLTDHIGLLDLQRIEDIEAVKHEIERVLETVEASRLPVAWQQRCVDPIALREEGKHVCRTRDPDRSVKKNQRPSLAGFEHFDLGPTASQL